MILSLFSHSSRSSGMASISFLVRSLEQTVSWCLLQVRLSMASSDRTVLTLSSFSVSGTAVTFGNITMKIIQFTSISRVVQFAGRMVSLPVLSKPHDQYTRIRFPTKTGAE